MSKNGIILIALAAILGTVYVINFTDWFRAKSIQIIPTIRVHGVMRAEDDPDKVAVYPVAFSFRGKHELTSVKVVAASDLATNKYPLALWELISDRASNPVEFLIYGQTPKGMKPVSPGLQAQALDPEVEYVLQLKTTTLEGQTNFQTRAVAP